jgi:hypothetical protein
MSVAIPLLFGQTIYPTIPLQSLQREQPLWNIEKSGWRELSLLLRALRIRICHEEYAIARAVKPLHFIQGAGILMLWQGGQALLYERHTASAGQHSQSAKEQVC